MAGFQKQGQPMGWLGWPPTTPLNVETSNNANNCFLSLQVYKYICVVLTQAYGQKKRIIFVDTPCSTFSLLWPLVGIA